MTVHRTAQGKMLDMAALAARNERVRAVGNMSVNARGDTIDSNGKVIVPVTRKVGEGYQKTVSNRAATLAKRKKETPKVDAIPAPETKVEIEDELEFMADELDLESENEALEIEKIKAAEKKIVIKPASEAPDFFKPED